LADDELAYLLPKVGLLDTLNLFNLAGYPEESMSTGHEVVMQMMEAIQSLM
jgi:hypothetical protein